MSRKKHFMQCDHGSEQNVIVEVMAQAGIYSMVRRPGCFPFVVGTKILAALIDPAAEPGKGKKGE